MKQKVFITRMIPEKALEMLKEHFTVKINEEDRNLTHTEIIEQVSDADAVICMLSDKIDKEVINAGKKVKIFANYAVGYNNIDIGEANKRGIVVTNTPDVLTDATADLAWALLFSAARCIVDSDQYTRSGYFKEWKPDLYLGMDITGKTLGILGAGRIGKAFARKSMGFNMKIIYNNRKRDEQFEKTIGAEWVDKNTLLKESDFISIHVPLTSETAHMIGEDELGIMKKTAVIINTSRGSVIDEKALVKALKSKQIWAAGLDVYENEPFLTEGLSELSNVIITPHIGSATIETRTQMAVIDAQNVIAVLQGKPPINPVK